MHFICIILCQSICTWSYRIFLRITPILSLISACIHMCHCKSVHMHFCESCIHTPTDICMHTCVSRNDSSCALHMYHCMACQMHLGMHGKNDLIHHVSLYVTNKEAHIHMHIHTFVSRRCEIACPALERQQHRDTYTHIQTCMHTYTHTYIHTHTYLCQQEV